MSVWTIVVAAGTGSRFGGEQPKQYLRLGDRLSYRPAIVNGSPGFLRLVDGQVESAQSLVTDGERVVAIYVVRNPDKLARIVAP